MSGLDPISGDVARELRRFPPVAGMAAIVAAWPRAVGSAIARNAWPARLSRDGTLHVTTSSSAWAFELSQLEADVRTRLAALLPGDAVVARLRFTPGALPEPPAEEPSKEVAAKRVVDAESAAEGARLAAAIGEEKLRTIVAKAAAASLARGASDRSL